LKKIFSGAVPGFGSVKNPIDITGGASINDYESALNAGFQSRAVHSIICLGCEAAGFDPRMLAPTIEKTYEKFRQSKPMVFSFFGGEKIEDSISYLKNRGVPISSDVYEAVSCLGAIYSNYRNLQHHEKGFTAIDVDDIDLDCDTIEHIIGQVRQDKRKFLLSKEAEAIMSAASIAMPQSRVARNLNNAVTCAEEIGYPVVMKVVSKEIIHKSDVGGVALDLENENELMDAYEAILYNCRQHNPDAHIEGVEVVEMVPRGLETIVGARRDNSFGPTVMFGLGGIYVEVMKDVSFRAYPMSEREAMRMISDIKSYPLMLGVRGEEKKDISGVATTILKIGAILYKFRDITDIEINPLMVYDIQKGVKALDARILLS
jgi:acetyltransferase